MRGHFARVKVVSDVVSRSSIKQRFLTTKEPHMPGSGPLEYYHPHEENTFEHFFSPLMDQGKDISIHYHLENPTTSNNFQTQFAIDSLNDFATPEEFRNYLMGKLDHSFHSLITHLHHSKSQSPDLELINLDMRLRNLKSLVTEETIIFNIGSSSYTDTKQFKTFARCRFVSSTGNHHLHSGQYFRFLSSNFAEVWVEVIDTAIKQLQNLRLVLKDAHSHDPQSNLSETSQDYAQLKFNLSVPQLAYFLKLLVKSNTIELPSRSISRLINWSVEHFQTKGQENIQSKSFRNKYTTPELSALDFWERLLKKLLAMIQSDRERLTK